MLELNQVCKKYGDFLVLDHLNMRLPAACIHCFVGPSGSGKSTLLNLITGVQVATSGTVKGLENAQIAYLFQEDRLLPWSTVEDNVCFVLSSHYEEDLARKKTDYYLEVVGLTAFKNSKPDQLSGGMKQRVALARAFAYGGEWLVMDEPFKGLDWDLKLTLMDYTVRLCKEEKKTLIYVTHDVQEAHYMADYVHEFDGPPLKLLKTKVITDSLEQRKRAYDKSLWDTPDKTGKDDIN